MTTASTPAIGPSPKAITNSSAKTSSGTVRQSSQTRRTAKRSQRLGPTLAAARKRQAEGADRPEQRADIGHQQGLAQKPQPARQAPEPFGEVRPGRLAALELEQADDVAREAADIVDEACRRDLGRHRRQQHRGHDAGEHEQRVQTTRPDRRVVGGEQRPELRLRQLDDGRAQVSVAACGRQLFCLRSESMNLISSTTGS